GVPDALPFRVAVYHLRRRSAPTSIRLEDPKTGSAGTTGACLLASIGASRPLTYTIPASIPHAFNISGAQLSFTTQALAYRGALASHTPNPRRETLINLDIVRHRIRDCTGLTLSNADIWAGCRDNAISRNISDFLWKGLHNAHRCGAYWKRIAHFEHRADCTTCDVPESLEHILTECTTSGQAAVWQMARTVWLKKHHEWSTPGLGDILGCGSMVIKDATGKPKPGRTRLWKILVSESAFLIWKTRNRQLFDASPCPRASLPTLLHSSWTRAVDNRLAIDQVLTKSSFKHRKLTRTLVLETWSGILESD
ncbi:hypothetical protein CERSUDRAFT_23064, partial [Gelatoporia subvermispora B]